MNEPQTLQVTVVFKVKHSPGTDYHLKEVLRNYLKAKGVEFNREDVVI
jgi:hypothetical protein